MADQVDIREVQSQFSRLVERAEHGEEIVVVRDGRPVAKLGPLSTAGAHGARRQPGRFAGQIEIGTDFDAPLPDDIADAFGA